MVDKPIMDSTGFYFVYFDLPIVCWLFLFFFLAVVLMGLVIFVVVLGLRFIF